MFFVEARLFAYTIAKVIMKRRVAVASMMFRVLIPCSKTVVIVEDARSG